jgi:hypothetical protein
VQPGQRIHESVFDKINKGVGYSPKAHLYGNLDWNSGEILQNALIEEDPYTKVAGILNELHNSVFNINNERLDLLLVLVRSGEHLLCV